MKKHITETRKQGKPLEVSIIDVPDWEGFEKLIMFVEKYYDAYVLDQYDGPDARRAFLKCQGVQFELIHQDGIGNYFVASSPDSEDLVITIGRDIEKRFRDAEEY